jgi:hypothetical protein
VEDALVELMRSDDVHLVAPPGSRVQVYNLGAKGRRTLQQAQLFVPQDRTLPVHFDGLLRRVVNLGRSSLLGHNQVRASGVLDIHPRPARRPELEDVKLSELDQFLRHQFPEGDGMPRRRAKNCWLSSLWHGGSGFTCLGSRLPTGL